ncbi:MAG: Ger(x)C family spore germination protein [Clostridiales bacterium]|nr:Ger(x)C family spore germination protein [Clostridiales bacterium]
MGKRLSLCLMCVALALVLSGCWNYRSLDEMDLVVGIAIDFDKEADLFKISFEVADLMGGSKDDAVKGRLVESEGKTLFDAVRNAKKKEEDRLFFGNALLVSVNQEVAREMGLSGILEWFLRDAECRETMSVVLSQEDTAKSILESPKDSGGIMSSTIYDIVAEDKQATGATIHFDLYRLYDMINSPRNAALLPAIHKIKMEDQEIPELNGIAICKGDKLAGFLSAEEAKYALMVEDMLERGILPLSLGEMPTYDISLEIFENKTRKSYTYEQDRMVVDIKTITNVTLAENLNKMDPMDKEQVKLIEDAAQRLIQNSIQDMIVKVQREYNVDIFGFGEMIYRKDPMLWDRLMPTWEEQFPTVEVKVTSKVHIVNSAFIK